MKTSELNRLLRGIINGTEFKLSIKNEVEAYELMMDKKGTSVPLTFEEDEEITLNNLSVQKLFLETISGNLTNIDLAYISDCLTLSEKVTFEAELARELFFEIADPEINGGYRSNTELEQLISLLKQNT